jgi:predicted aspartyl protease
MTAWCRVKGSNDKIRELEAAIDFNYSYCLMLRQDAADLGYSEASYRHSGWHELRPDRAPLVLTARGIERTILINLKEVSVGKLAAKNVAAVVLEYDLPAMVPVDMILGQTFLKNFKLGLDPRSRTLSLSRRWI